MKILKRNILLNPGPATTTNSVKWSQVVPDICPREAEFGDLMAKIARELTEFVGNHDEYTTVLFSGSGTAAVEAILSSVISDEDYLLIINNGAYGKRMCDIANIYGVDIKEFQSVPYESIDLNRLEHAIQTSDRRISHLALVHHETTTGLLNDVGAIGRICSKHNIELFVDGMSSYAAIPIQMKEMNISYLAASSNKNLQGTAGISFVVSNVNKLKQLKSMRKRNYYLNLYEQYKYFSETKQMRFTPPVQTMYALEQAINELKEEGITARYDRYTKSWGCLIRGIKQMGLSYLVDDDNHSKIITAIIEPDNPHYKFDHMHDYFYKNNIMIYPGKLNHYNTFRIANMGDICYKDIDRFLELLQCYLDDLSILKKIEH
ncbi:2-aminoethylphosphonate aminotransferase [Chengkuizengella axinellae]|uniref:2-aminoethylphosphonate--pyruvate transaminase n=1 Tax=Chengkuizengella axinellae TaxID=3064388 RepID=A0ABT9J1F8_9BACL|nr:2-aminoethylphosphonate--pyruvate transaminase [Chengkuizengella sp. 2205SS18-9]MDP5275454.1 2-aminoethylphosphonate--pyruvate transaminase [Chengkuizengella sp. 2205SS18-9]